MYKILIVDDEPYICIGLQALIKRIDIPEIGEIFTTTNYADTERVVREQSPEIIITDINMPEVSGIELIKCIKNISHEAKFIVLSGYNEFDYVKEAFKVGIADYLLKPAEKEEMEELLKKVISVIEDERHQKNKNIDDNQVKWKMMLENRLNKIFYYENQADNDLHIYNELKSIFKYDYFCIGILNISSLHPDNGGESTNRYISEIRDELALNSKSQVFCFGNSKNNIIFVFNTLEEHLYKGISISIKCIIKRLRENQKITAYFSLSDMDKDILKLRELYERAESILAYKILIDEDEGIELESNKGRGLDFNKLDFDFGKFERALRDNKFDVTDKLIDSLFTKENLKNQSIEAIEKLYEKVIWYLSISLENEKAIYTQDLFRKLNSFSSLEELRKYIKDTVLRINEMIKQSSNEKNVIEIAKKYIKQNFYKDISMAVVANTVSMNYTYFSKIFKDETGKNFSEFLIGARMEEAKRLLKDPSKKIYEISLKVGYENPKHFTRTFKKQYDVSPEQYRKSIE
jgi:two-component system, response regulator YesN